MQRLRPLRLLAVQHTSVKNAPTSAAPYLLGDVCYGKNEPFRPMEILALRTQAIVLDTHLAAQLVQ